MEGKVMGGGGVINDFSLAKLDLRSMNLQSLTPN